LNSDTREMLKLQNVDLELIRLRRELEYIPLREQEIQKELDELKDLVVNADGEVRDLEKQTRALEGEVDSSRENQERLKIRQMEVKTNKEYQAILSEIDFQEKEVYKKEDAILDLMEKSQTAVKEAEINKKRFDEDSRRLKSEQKRLAESIIFLENEIAQNQEKHNMIEQELPVHLLDLYNRRAATSGGMPMANARGEICQVCHVRVRPQVYQELKITDKLHQCESCKRILYFLDEDE